MRKTTVDGRSRRLQPPRQQTDGAAPASVTAAPRGLLALQRQAGNQAVQRLLAQPVVQRKLVTIGSEQVRVRNDEEKAEAEAIVKRIKDLYGVELSSATTIEALKAEYPDVKTKVKDKLRARSWRMRDLRALEMALAAYAPILGGKRATSTRSGEAQEVTSVGKLQSSIDEDTPAGKLDPDTVGEYFQTKKNMGLFRSAEGHLEDFHKSETKSLTFTFVHETAHGLLVYALPAFVKASGYWKDEDTRLPTKKRTESPPTEYARENAEEDLCETAAMFFVDRKRLEKRCPKRFAFMVKITNDWIPAPAKAPALMTAPTNAPVPVGAGK